MNAKLLIHTKDPFVLLLFYFSCYHIRNIFNEKSSSKIKNTIPQHRKLRFNHFEVRVGEKSKFWCDRWQVFWECLDLENRTKFRKWNPNSDCLSIKSYFDFKNSNMEWNLMLWYHVKLILARGLVNTLQVRRLYPDCYMLN